MGIWQFIDQTQTPGRWQILKVARCVQARLTPVYDRRREKVVELVTELRTAATLRRAGRCMRASRRVENQGKSPRIMEAATRPERAAIGTPPPGWVVPPVK